MKRLYHTQKVFASVLAGLMPLLAGCGDHLSLPESEGIAPVTSAEVLVPIQIGESADNARTLIPDNAAPPFNRYVVQFQPLADTRGNPGSIDSGVFDDPAANTTYHNTLPLSVGRWSISVIGYLALAQGLEGVNSQIQQVSGTIAQKTIRIIAEQELPYTYTPQEGDVAGSADYTNVFMLINHGTGIVPVKIAEMTSDNIGQSARILIELTPQISGVTMKGTFKYNISFRSGNFAQGSLEFFTLNGQQVNANPFLAENLTYPYPTLVRTPVNRSGAVLLDPGYYLLKVKMNNRIVKTEILHIYSALTTKTPEPVPSSTAGRNEYVFYDGEFDNSQNLQTYLTSAPENTSAAPYWIRYSNNTIVDLHSLSSPPQNKYVYLDLGNYGSAIIMTGWTKLVGITLPDGLGGIDTDAFRGCTALAKVELPASLTDIRDRAFQGCTALASVTLRPDTANPAPLLATIGDDAFQGCTALAAMPFQQTKSLRSIGARAFQGSGLTSADFPRAASSQPSALRSIGIAAFKDSRLQTVNLRYVTNITSIDAEVFRGCTALTSVTLPDQVANIGQSAFAGCTALQSISLTEVSVINDYAFQDCTALESVSFSNGLNTIGNYAFQGSKLREADLRYSPLNIIGASAFRNCTYLQTAYLPDTSYTIGAEAFGGCGILTVNVYAATSANTGTPPVLAGLSNNQFPSNIPILVPQNRVTAYKDAWTAYASQIFGF
ncbi:MAG: leucine-rich repeat domain-containing protein [Spirochaetaceae bacterium]|jgi:hypothetical protein|nr:leucine-rich repeat domain-containing protein [Spirochaetaceae bacterium]